jgi:hypothetical protein
MLTMTFTVPELAVKVVTGDSCYPRENGFSSIVAKVAPEDGRLADKLAQAQAGKVTVTLRCAMLDVTGKIANSLSEGGKKVFILNVDDLIYRKPGSVS